MDLRGYGLPTHLGYFPYPREGLSETASNPKGPYAQQRGYSFGDLSLSDGPDPEDMPRRCGSKDHVPKGSSRNTDSKCPRSKKHLAAPKNNNSGIDVALRNLDHEVSTSLRMFQDFMQGFQGQIEPLQDWAEDFTLDTIWRNKVKDKFREKGERERFEGMPGRILGYRVSVKDAIGKAKTLEAAWDDQYKMERQIRTGKKAILYSDGIIHLAERALSERLACKQPVLELEEARSLLDRKRHPWIYGEEVIEQQDDDVQKRRNRSKKSRSRRSQRSEMGSDERFEAQDEGDRTERQDEAKYPFR